MKTKSIILETLANINAAIAADKNALTSTRAGEVSPERAYIELVRELLALEGVEAPAPVKAASKPAAARKPRTVTKPAAALPRPTPDRLRAARMQLDKTVRGRDCITHLRAFFHEAAPLDKENGEAVQMIIAGFFDGCTGTALEVVAP